jgi:hypothetical protein
LESDPDCEIDFSGAKRGHFYKPCAQLNLPVYLDQKVQATLAALANAKGVDFSVLINDLLKKDIELIGDPGINWNLSPINAASPKG